MSKYRKQSKTLVALFVALFVAAFVAVQGLLWMLFIGSFHSSFGWPVSTISFPVACGQALLVSAAAGLVGIGKNARVN